MARRDPELFDEIFKSYPNTIRDAKALNESRRSSLPVISAINAIFSPSSIRPFGDAAAEAWGKMWCEHTSHADCGTDGCAAYLEVSDVESKIDAVYGILKEIDPSKRGLECAVLVYKNKQVENIIDGLRARAKKDGFPLPVAGELDCSISDDNMVVPAVLSLLKSAAHPGEYYLSGLCANDAAGKVHKAAGLEGEYSVGNFKLRFREIFIKEIYVAKSRRRYKWKFLARQV